MSEEGTASTEDWKRSLVTGRQHWENKIMGSVAEADVIPNIADRHNDQPQLQQEQRGDEAEPRDREELVEWRGNFVPKKEAKGLCHVFDELQDHFGHQRPDPNVRFNVSLAHHNSGNDGTWRGDVDFTYNINGDFCNLGYVGVDVCLDLSPKHMHRQGRPMLNGYGHSWVYAYLPETTMDNIKSYVRIGTGLDVSTEGMVYDPNRNLVAIEARMNHRNDDPRPCFWVVDHNQSPIITTGEGEDVPFTRVGSVQDVYGDPNQQRVHRGVGIFSVSLEVYGTPNFKPSPGMYGYEASLVFTLVSIRTWGVTDCIAPIVYSPRRW
jgi:hypothetical protein